MNFDWLPFLLAVALLSLPRAWMRRGPSLWRSRHSHGPATGSLDSGSLAFRRESLNLRNYFDLARAAAAGCAIVGGQGLAPSISPAAGAPAAAKVQVLLVQAAVLAVGVLVQTVRFERRRFSLAAPVFYLAGLAMALCTPLAGLGAFTIAWLLTSVVPNAQAFLVVLAGLAAGLGVLLNGVSPFILLGAALCFLPVLLSLLSRQPLLVFSHRTGSRTVNA